MKKIVITAANSFIGHRLCRVLVDGGYFIYAVVREKSAMQEELKKLGNLQIVYAEMKSYGELCQMISDKCDVGIALAWSGTRGADRNNVNVQKQNYENSMKCIESFLKLGCKLIVTAGSQAEYGLHGSVKKIDENCKCVPNTEYGKYKLKFYTSVLEKCQTKQVRVIEPRFFSLYGQDDYEGTMIISMIRNMIQNKPCRLTECIQTWDFLHVDDAIRALYKLIISDTAEGIYNFGSGESRELKEYVMMMYKYSNSRSKLLYGAIPYPQTGMVNTNPDITRLHNTIQWEPEISFKEGIIGVIEEQKKKIHI